MRAPTFLMLSALAILAPAAITPQAAAGRGAHCARTMRGALDHHPHVSTHKRRRARRVARNYRR